jgi:hypothetical protein
MCGQHFCYACGAGEPGWSADDCYDHMTKKHGGAFYADDYDDE